MARRERAWRSEYPEAVFFGYRHGQELGAIYAAADLFVFPSRTDTFGVVMIEALASGLPVAAYPVDRAARHHHERQARCARQRSGEGRGAGTRDRRPGRVRGRGAKLHLGEMHAAVSGEPGGDQNETGPSRLPQLTTKRTGRIQFHSHVTETSLLVFSPTLPAASVACAWTVKGPPGAKANDQVAKLSLLVASKNCSLRR